MSSAGHSGDCSEQKNVSSIVAEEQSLNISKVWIIFFLSLQGCSSAPDSESTEEDASVISMLVTIACKIFAALRSKGRMSDEVSVLDQAVTGIFYRYL